MHSRSLSVSTSILAALSITFFGCAGHKDSPSAGTGANDPTASNGTNNSGTGATGGDSTASASDESQLTADGEEASEASAQSTNLGAVVFGSVTSVDPDKASDDVAAAGHLWPASCHTRVKDPTNRRVVHITFDDCTGPFGLVHLSGHVTVTFSSTDKGELRADYQSSDLTANGHPITWTASADITVNGNERDVTWHGVWDRTTDKGKTVSHTSDATIVDDVTTQCRTTNGTAVTTVDNREVDTTVKDYKICRDPDGSDSCPTGTVTHTRKSSGLSVTATFDGTNKATVVGPHGHSTEVPLVCGS
jgi:hypothetical protein